MTLQKNDFIEVDFIAKTQDKEVFDSNIKEEVEKLNPEEVEKQAKPFKFALGQGMFLQGIDDFLMGKEIGEYEIELTPEKAFGKRDSKQIQMMPISVFKEHNLNPSPGLMVNFDGKVAKILTVSGGRVIVDFNHPLAGKNVIYEINVKRKINNKEEKIKSLNEFLFKQNLDFEIKDKKLVLKVDNKIKKFAELFKDKYKEILDLDLVVEQEAEDKNNNKETSKEESKEFNQKQSKEKNIK